MNRFEKFKKYIREQEYIDDNMLEVSADFNIVQEYYRNMGIKNSDKIVKESENMYLVDQEEGGVIFTQDKRSKIKEIFLLFEEEVYLKCGSIYICHEMSHYIYVYNRLNKKMKDNIINLEIPSYYCEYDFSKMINRENDMETYRYNYAIADADTYNEDTPYMVAYYYLNYLKEQNQDKLKMYIKSILNGKINIQELIGEYSLNYENKDILEANIEYVKKYRK